MVSHMSRRRRDIAREIAGSKERASEWPQGVAHIARLVNLKDDLRQVDETATGLFWYFPVALISSIEAFFKESISALIDSGSPYVDRVQDLHLRPISVQDFMELRGHKITLGEFAAHQQPYSSLETINHTVSTIIGSDFLEGLKKTEQRLPWQSKALRPGLLLGEDPGAIFESLKKCFEVRHRVCHGHPPRRPIAREGVEVMVEAVDDFLTASFYFFAGLLLAHVPATRHERQKVRRESATIAEKSMKEAMSRLAGTLPPRRQELLQQAQTAFEEFAELDARLAGGAFEGGWMEIERYFDCLAYRRETRAAELDSHLYDPLRDVLAQIKR